METKEPFASVLRGNLEGVAASGEKGLAELLGATHAGVTTDAFRKEASDWIDTARHPKTGQLFTQMVYQPMLELLAYLRANGFKTFIVSGGVASRRERDRERYGGGSCPHDGSALLSAT